MKATTFIVTVDGADEAELDAWDVKDAIARTGLVDAAAVSVQQLRPGVVVKDHSHRGAVVEVC